MFGLVFCLESRSYVVQENTTDDAAAPLHAGDGCQIEVPGKSVGCTLQHGESLSI